MTPSAQPFTIRIHLDDCVHGGAECTIYKTWQAFEATTFQPTRSQALAVAVAQWRRHTRYMRTKRKETQMARQVESDPICQMARQLEADIAAERTAQSLATVAMRFYTDEPDNDVGIRPRGVLEAA